MTSQHEIALMRLVAQRIAGSRHDSPAGAVRWLAAAQAQDLPGALASIALRTTGGAVEEVEAALMRGEIVRSWPMRGTLHLVMAEDLPWMLQLAGPRMLRSAATRRAQLGVDDSALDRARPLAIAALRDGGALSRDELLALWTDSGLDATGSRGSHLLGVLAQQGLVCFGPMRGREQLLVLIEEWIPNPRRLDREQALGDWVERYFRSHGPATIRDAVRWTGLTVADVRAGLATAGSRLGRIEVDGVEYLMDSETHDRLEAHRDAARGVFLLPGFDELILGYADRSATLPGEFAERIVPGGNGVFQPTVIDDGRVVGIWKRVGRGARQRIETTPFTRFRDEVSDALPRLIAALP